MSSFIRRFDEDRARARGGDIARAGRAAESNRGSPALSLRGDPSHAPPTTTLDDDARRRVAAAKGCGSTSHGAHYSSGGGGESARAIGGWSEGLRSYPANHGGGGGGGGDVGGGGGDVGGGGAVNSYDGSASRTLTSYSGCGGGAALGDGYVLVCCGLIRHNKWFRQPNSRYGASSSIVRCHAISILANRYGGRYGEGFDEATLDAAFDETWDDSHTHERVSERLW